MQAINFLGGILGMYRVVPANEVHVRVMFDKREAFCCRERFKPSYWVIPFVTKLHKLPLTNLRVEVPDVKLNDKNMAKFSCDVTCFVNISDPMLCAERTDITSAQENYEESIEKVASDLRIIMESVGRTVSTKQTILEIYMDRNKLDEAVTKEVSTVFPRWGLELVDLEIKDIKDMAGSTIISDIEAKRAAEINSEKRIVVANKDKEARIVEAEATQAAEMRKAETEEQWKKRQVERDRTIAVAEQEKEQKKAEAEALANIKKIEAKRKIEVGSAEVEKEATVQRATATREKLKLEAEGEASKVQQIGTSEARIIQAKKEADAAGTSKLADAQRKFNDAATNIELIKAGKEVQIAYAKAYEVGLNNAHINIITGQTKNLVSKGLLGDISVGPEEGMALNQMAQAAGKNNMEMINKIASQLGFVRKESPTEEKQEVIPDEDLPIEDEIAEEEPTPEEQPEERNFKKKKGRR